MIFHRSTIGATIVFFFIASIAAEAMTLLVRQSGVLVNNGNGFRPVSGSTSVAPGASVLVNSGGAAELKCSNGVNLFYTEPGYYSVPIDCTGGQSQTPSFTIEALGDAGPFLVSGAVIGGAIAIIKATGSDDQPASD